MTKEELEELYLNQKLSAQEIANQLGSYKKAIQRLLKKYDIPIRTSGESRAIYLKNNPDKNPIVKLNTERTKNKKIIIPKQKLYYYTRDFLDVEDITTSWNIEEYKTSHGNIRKHLYVYVDGEKGLINGSVNFICNICNKQKSLTTHYFIEQNGEKICRGCKAQRTKIANGWKMTESAKKILSEQRIGVEKNTDYFDFTCPVCGKTFSYRNILTNRKKKYCSKECQLSVWILAGSSNLERQGYIFEYDVVKELQRQGYSVEFSPQKLVNNRFPVDAYLPDIDVYLQADGIYWHAKPGLYKEEELDENQLRHIRNDAEFKKCCLSQKIKFARFWQDDFYNDPENTIKSAIQRALNLYK